MEQVQAFLQYPLAQTVIAGILTGIAGDIAAFRAWKSWNDAATYSWSTFTFRAFQGGVVGLLTGLGIAGIA